MSYGTNQLQLKRNMRVFSCKNAKRVCLHACHHTLLHAFPFVTKLLLQAYGHYPSTTCFHTLSVTHLDIPNDAESNKNQESNARIKRLNNRKNMVLTERNSFMTYQGMPELFLDTNQSQ